MVVVALLCVVAMAAVAISLGGSDGDAAGNSSSVTEDTGAANTLGNTETTTAGDCTTPPAPAEPKTYTEVPSPSIAEDSLWKATITTNCGVIGLELDGKNSPQTVSSFIQLAKDGYWDDSPCHRLTTEGIFVLQCGDPTGTGSGNPGYGFGIENAPASGAYPTGTLAMARSSDPNSNGGQFFIVYDDTTLATEGGGYSIFGEVTSGRDIVTAVGRRSGPPRRVARRRRLCPADHALLRLAIGWHGGTIGRRGVRRRAPAHRTPPVADAGPVRRWRSRSGRV